MSTPPKNPAVVGAILKGAAVELVLLVLGVAIYLGTGSVLGIIGAVVLGTPVMILLMAQAGAFKR